MNTSKNDSIVLQNVPANARRIVYSHLDPKSKALLKSSNKFMKSNVEITKSKEQIEQAMVLKQLIDNYKKRFSIYTKQFIAEAKFKHNMQKVHSIGKAISKFIDVPQDSKNTTIIKFFQNLIDAYKSILKRTETCLDSCVETIYNSLASDIYNSVFTFYGSEFHFRVSEIKDVYSYYLTKNDIEELEDINDKIDKAYQKAYKSNSNSNGNSNSSYNGSYDEDQHVYYGSLVEQIIERYWYLRNDMVMEFCGNNRYEYDDSDCDLDDKFDELYHVIVHHLQSRGMHNLKKELEKCFQDTSQSNSEASYNESSSVSEKSNSNISSGKSDSSPSSSTSANSYRSSKHSAGANTSANVQSDNGLAQFVRDVIKICCQESSNNSKSIKSQSSLGSSSSIISRNEVVINTQNNSENSSLSTNKLIDTLFGEYGGIAMHMKKLSLREKGNYRLRIYGLTQTDVQNETLSYFNIERLLINRDIKVENLTRIQFVKELKKLLVHLVNLGRKNNSKIRIRIHGRDMERRIIVLF